MNTLRKWVALVAITALVAVGTFSPVVQADEYRVDDKTVVEGNRGRGRGGRHGGGRGGRHRGGRRHRGGGSGWAWAGLGAAVGLGIVSALTDDSDHYTYVEPVPSYEVVYPGTTTYYYPAPAYPTEVYVQPQPQYVQPNYGQTYVVPAPCTACP